MNPLDSPTGLPWLSGEGDRASLVISTRIRLARNLKSHLFGPVVLTGEVGESGAILNELERAAFGVGSLLRLGTLSAMDRLRLHERQLISSELAKQGEGSAWESGLLVTSDATAMVNEEDHLRIQSLVPGLGLHAAHQAADHLDTTLGSRLSFAFHSEFGYLTSCPTNVGTGLRASVLIHLPGLVRTGEFQRTMRGMREMGLTSRGWHGEGSEMLGHLVQLSNQTTMGRSEEELLNHLGGLVRQVIEYESRAREAMWANAPALIEDQIWRAFGVLRFAQRMTLEEGLDLLSLVRLGVVQGVLPSIGMGELNQLLVKIQTAHLAYDARAGLDDRGLESHRAAVIRRVLAERGVGK